MTPERYAAIDVGTNTCKMLVASVSTDGIVRHIDFTIRKSRLGEGAFADHLLKPDAVRRTSEVLKEFRTKAIGLGVSRICAVSTQALRAAYNARDVVDLFSRETGVSVVVISGETEAELTLLGAALDLPLAMNVLCINSGGGSTEFALRAEDRYRSVTVPIGALSLTSMYVKHDPPETAEVAAMDKRIAVELSNVVPLCQGYKVLNEVVAIGGTAVSLALIARGNESRDVSQAHLYRIGEGTVKAFIERMSLCTRTQRMSIRGMDPDRADMMLAGALILSRSLVLFDQPSLLVSTRSISDGVICKLKANEPIQPHSVGCECSRSPRE